VFIPQEVASLSALKNISQMKFEDMNTFTGINHHTSNMEDINHHPRVSCSALRYINITNIPSIMDP